MTAGKRVQFSYDICIVGGAGHVGLPLGIAFAQKQQRVVLYDRNLEALRTIESGRLPFMEHGAEGILRDVVGRTLFCSRDIASVSQAKFVVVTIGTPVDEYLNPELRAVPATVSNLAEYLRPEQTLIIRSTVFPGTCRRVLQTLVARDDRDWKVAYCPERIAQGHAIRELAELPQIVSGLSEAATREGAELFALISPRVVETSVEEAELAKLFTNAWRYIQFAAANQFYTIAKQLGVDFSAVWSAMTTGYPRAAGLPRAGLAAGPCLMKDTMQVVAASEGAFSLGQAAMTVNEGMPAVLVGHLRRLRDLNGLRVGILGMGFKANIDDIRDSLAYKLRKILEFHGAIVSCSDEYVCDPAFVTKETLIASSDAIIIGVPHAAYRHIVIPEGVHLIDLWAVVAAESVRATAVLKA